ncbi:FAD-dependent oxidoreductase [Micromonospora sp. M12]
MFYGAAATEAPSCVEQDVYIVGGANSAGQAAVHFSRYASRVHLLIRGADLTASMSRYLIDQLERIDRITVHPYTAVVGGEGDDHLERLTLCDTRTGESRSVDTSWLFIFIGAEPRTDWLEGWWSGTAVASSSPVRTCSPEGGGRPAGRCHATRTTWRPACRACSPPVTCGPSRSSGSPRPSARERWLSRSCTVTWRASEREE